MQLNATIPLFPLGVVLLPRMVLPLHIFEERYKLMINDCLEQDKEFGVVYFDDNEIREKGCATKIMKVAKRYDDGRLDIVTRGGNRFVIKDIIDEKPYLQARVVYFDDATEKSTLELQSLIKEGINLLQQWESLTGKETDYNLVSGLNAKVVSFLIAYSDGFTADEKQRFLEMTSTRERIKESVESLKKIVELGKKRLTI
jgi:Lon protease-like protein